MSHCSSPRTHSLSYIGHRLYFLEQQLTDISSALFSPEFDEKTLLPETKENVVCALGLIVGLVGIVAGIILSIKGLKKCNATERRQGAL